VRPEHSPLQLGARVALIGTSGPPPVGQLDRAVLQLKEWGLDPVVGTSADARHPRADYLLGTDQQRAADLQWAWCDPEIDAVFCIRGGYGAARILDLLDVDVLRAARHKPIFGSSDVTAIAEFWLERLGCGFWFSPMVTSAALLDDDLARAGLTDAIFEPAEGRAFTSSAAGSILRGQATGPLIGGNLAVLAMTTGARGRPPLDNAGCLALIEDVTEPTYKIDGFLTSLLRAGWFDGVAGVALGSWRDCGPLDEIHALAEELLTPLGVPVVWELGFGHVPGAHSIPLGATATLFADDAPRLVLAGG
jgi:muramoyltetrapeptide carboxypeptidase